MRLLRWLALPAMLVFLGVGCGDDNTTTPQQDGTVPPADAATGDVAHEDAEVQEDAPVQEDAAVPPSGLFTITQVSPAPVGNPAVDNLKLPLINPNWSVGDAAGDHPTNSLDRFSGITGCVAKYYKFSATDVMRPSTFNAGPVTVSSSAAWHGGVGLLPDMDAGAPIPSPVVCNRVETVADAGLFEYKCEGVPTIATAFIEPGDRLWVEGGGAAYDVPAFALPDAGAGLVAFPHVTTTVATIPALYALPALFQSGGEGDGGVTLEFGCGLTDGGTAAACSLAFAIVIESSDATPLSSLQPGKPVAEYGRVQCSTVGGGTSYKIPEDMWLTAFPPTSQWKTMRTSVTHMSINMTPELGMKLPIGIGGGEIGMYVKPDGG